MNKFETCEICGESNDESIGWHYGVVTCQACKKFFLRSEKLKNVHYQCNHNGNCLIVMTTRTNCQFCRYKKCKQKGMDLNMKWKNETKVEIKNELCLICTTNPSSGIHFGVKTCESCKGFFGRSVKDKKHERFMCRFNQQCSLVAIASCRYCRFAKCLNVGMSPDSCRIGRPTNLSKYHSETSVQSNENSPDKPVSKRFKSEIIDNQDSQPNLFSAENIFNDNYLLSYNLNHMNWYSQIRKQSTEFYNNYNFGASSAHNSSVLNDANKMPTFGYPNYIDPFYNLKVNNRLSNFNQDSN